MIPEVINWFIVLLDPEFARTVVSYLWSEMEVKRKKRCYDEIKETNEQEHGFVGCILQWSDCNNGNKSND